MRKLTSAYKNHYVDPQRSIRGVLVELLDAIDGLDESGEDVEQIIISMSPMDDDRYGYQAHVLTI